MSSLYSLIAAWLDASHRSWDGVWLNRCARESSVKLFEQSWGLILCCIKTDFLKSCFVFFQNGHACCSFQAACRRGKRNKKERKEQGSDEVDTVAGGWFKRRLDRARVNQTAVSVTQQSVRQPVSSNVTVSRSHVGYERHRNKTAGRGTDEGFKGVM